MQRMLQRMLGKISSHLRDDDIRTLHSASDRLPFRRVEDRIF